MLVLLRLRRMRRARAELHDFMDECHARINRIALRIGPGHSRSNATGLHWLDENMCGSPMELPATEPPPTSAPDVDYPWSSFASNRECRSELTAFLGRGELHEASVPNSRPWSRLMIRQSISERWIWAQEKW